MIDRLESLGFIFRFFRKQKNLSQEGLAEELGSSVSRTAVALLEQGRRAPPRHVFEMISERLGIPEAIWAPFAQHESSQRQEFESAISELVGRAVFINLLHLEAIGTVEGLIQSLFRHEHTPTQSFDILNSIFVFYDIRAMSWPFYQRYFEIGAFQSTASLEVSIQTFQVEAIRLFSTFSQAYRAMNEGASLDKLLEPLKTRETRAYSQRTVWDSGLESSRYPARIREIDEARLPFLGYISVDQYRKQKKKREVLAKYLRELATSIRSSGGQAIDELSTKKKRRIDSLMTELDSTLQHSPISPLFVPNPIELEEEAGRILRKEQDEPEMARTQSEAMSNLAAYVSADYMDVYVATSMRTASDFISVNRFVKKLFSDHRVAPLRLRYFNPTQSWIEDRVAKGLVEALMLRRASFTIYMAQKSDTFGKDSEASVALGQGKPVIVYVPKLNFQPANIDSEKLYLLSDSALKKLISEKGDDDEKEIDDTLDHNGLYSQAVHILLRELSNQRLLELVERHWADFGLLDESERIKGNGEALRRERYSHWLSDVRTGELELARQEIDSQPLLRDDVLIIVSALTVNFEKRAKVFREIHPLALQVILSTGVLNGILVCRSFESCATILRQLIENTMELFLDKDTDNYRLIEKTTGSTIRVISRNKLLTYAFSSFYSEK